MNITLKELKILVENGYTPKINTPSGYESIIDTYTKNGPGIEIYFENDPTVLKCANHHLIWVNNKWVESINLKVGDIINDKVIINIVKVFPQDWIDFTIDAEHESYYHQGILHHNSGKSAIIYTLIRHHLNQDRKCIIIVPSTQLVEQLYSDFQDYSSNNGFVVSDNIQRLYSGFSKYLTTSVLITTWQSIVKMPKGFYNQFDVVIGDEAHQFKSVSLISIMENMTNIEYRVGTTGTLDGSKVNKLVLEGVFGREYVVTTTRALMDQGKVVDLKISCLILKYDKETREALKGMDYKEEMMWLVTNPERNKFIRNLALSTSGNTLVLFQYVEKHGKKLYEMISSKAQEGRKVFFIHGGIDTEVREHIRKLCGSEKDAIIVASFGVFSTGINIPSIKNIVFASPYKSKIKVLQSIGRGLRLDADKTQCKLFDIADDLSWKASKNHTLNHAAERYKLYMKEEFKVKLVEIDIK